MGSQDEREWDNKGQGLGDKVGPEVQYRKHWAWTLPVSGTVTSCH